MRLRNKFVNCICGLRLGSVGCEIRDVLSRWLPSFLAILFLAIPAWSQSKGEVLSNLSIEDLMNLEVTSVSKTDQKLSRTASAVFVIGQEDIRSSGVLNIPDLLRMVPGMDVAQITSNTWAVGARGFNGRFSNKLLVLLDGRRVYTPTNGAVFWDVLNLPLEDIASIEVIRGPGGSVWGANAVDGVINIITKKAGETRGGLVTGGGGNLDQGFGTVQYGGTVDKEVDYRIYTQYQNQNHLPNAAGQAGGDGWHLLQGGFRTDSKLSTNDTLMVQGNLYAGSENIPATFLPSVSSPTPQFVDAPAHLSGGFIQSVWNHSFSARRNTTLEISYDTYQRDDALREGRKTLNADFQHHILWGDRQDVLWGLAFAYSPSNSQGNLLVALDPPSANATLFSSFAQDEIALVPERLYLTLGTKLEHNYYTGWAAMPSVRLAWQIGDRHTLWTAFSHPSRTPDETNVAVRATPTGFIGQGGIPALLEIVGNPDYQNEKLLAYETGYRAAISTKVYFDFAAYYNDYTDLQTTEPGAPFPESSPPPFHLVLPLTYGNLMHGETHGFEISTDWKVTNRWSLSPGYAFEKIHMHLAPISQDTTSVLVAEGSSPDHSAQLRSRVNLAHGLEWNVSVYYVNNLPSGNIPAYTRLDTNLIWKWSEKGTFSLVGQNLLHDRFLEFHDSTNSIIATEAKRSAYAKLTWYF